MAPPTVSSGCCRGAIGVFAAYASNKGRALVDRELYLPKTTLARPGSPTEVRGRGIITLNLFDRLSAHRPRRPGAYLRVSSHRFGLEAGIDGQQRTPRTPAGTCSGAPSRTSTARTTPQPSRSARSSARRVARMHLAAAQQGKVQGRIAYGWIGKGPERAGSSEAKQPSSAMSSQAA